MDFKKSDIALILKKALAWISFKRLFLLFATALVAIFSLTVFEGRSFITGALESREISTALKEPTFTLSTALQNRLTGAVIRSTAIIGLSVHTVNLKVNEKHLIFQYSDAPTITQIWEQRRLHGSVNAMFGTDQMSNLQMVAVMNGGFICLKFSETQMYRNIPELAPHIVSICQLSIPPFYGNFGGFITVFLNQPLTSDIETEIRTDLVRASNDVYSELLLNRRVSNPK